MTFGAHLVPPRPDATSDNEEENGPEAETSPET